MAYDEELADRLRDLLADESDVTEKKMCESARMTSVPGVNSPSGPGSG